MSETKLGVALRIDFGSDFEDADEFREAVAEKVNEEVISFVEYPDGTNELSFKVPNYELVINDDYYGIDYIVTERDSQDFSEFSVSSVWVDNVGVSISETLGSEILGLAKDLKITFYQWYTSADRF